MTKTRAGRNRTLVLTDRDREILQGSLDDETVLLTKENCTDRLVCGDLFNVMDRLPEEVADLLIIDPPYNLTKDFGGMTFRGSSDADYEAYVRSWLPGLMRCLKPAGSVYVCCDWRSSGVISRVLSEYCTIKNRITWQRDKGRGARRNWKNNMEDIWFGVKDDKAYYFDVDAVKIRRRVLAPYKENGKPKDWEESQDGKYRLTCPSNLWDDISVPYWSMRENTEHPTQKPEKLMARLILASCPPDGLVLDPFLGCGTTAVAAKKLGRHFLGVEIIPEYALLAAKRLQMAECDKSIQGYRDGIFLERNSR